MALEKIAEMTATGGGTDLSNYYTKAETYSRSEADSKFAPKGSTGGGGSVDLSQYALKDDVYTRSEVYTRTEANDRFALKGAGGGTTPDLSQYLTRSDAQNTYLTRSDAQNNYLTRSDGDNRYQLKNDSSQQQIVTDTVSFNFTISGGNFGSTKVNFSRTFSQAPQVTLESSNTQVNLCIQALSTSGFTLAGMAINGGTQSISGYAHAMGLA